MDWLDVAGQVSLGVAVLWAVYRIIRLARLIFGGPLTWGRKRQP